MSWETLLGAALIANVYVLVYYRLMVRFHQQHAEGRPQKTIAALLSVPPYRKLPARGRSYARRWWWALLAMTAIICVLALRLDFKPRSPDDSAPPSASAPHTQQP